MSKFFREETKRRIVVCVTAATIATSSLVAGVTPVFAETSSDAATTTVEAPAASTADPTSSTFTFTQGNIPGARENVPSDKFATQFVSDVSLNGTKFIGDSGAQVTAPSGLTDPDGHTVVKWMTEDGSDEMAPGETREIDTLNVETFHAVWQPQDNGHDVQYRLVVNANGGHFEGGIDFMNERHDFLPANMHNVRAATKVVRDGYTLVGFSRNKNDVTAPASTLTSPISIRDAEHIPGHTTEDALPTKTDEIYTVYAIWRSNTETPADPSTPADSETPGQNAQEQSNNTAQEQTSSRRRSKKSVLPETGDAVSATGLLASAGSILAAAGFMRRRKH